MSFSNLLVTEIFHSIQGESSLSGIPFAFIRLTGCNLRCTYCDSSYAFKGGKPLAISEILETIRPFETRHVLLTGGEPLLQRPAPKLAKTLVGEGYYVSIETHGEVSIEAVAPFTRIIMDIKTPSSGMCRKGFIRNFPFLKKTDEIKFVIASPEDYEWARTLMMENPLPTQEILFSAALPGKNTPGQYPGVNPTWLAERILEDRLPVRFQLQVHKYLWGSEQRGV